LNLPPIGEETLVLCMVLATMAGMLLGFAIGYGLKEGKHSNEMASVMRIAKRISETNHTAAKGVSDPKVLVRYRWITEHEQLMERANPWPPGRALHSFELRPVAGPLLQIGYSFEKDGKKYEAAIMIDPDKPKKKKGAPKGPAIFPPANHLLC
jgi:hypothetical protein